MSTASTVPEPAHLDVAPFVAVTFSPVAPAARAHQQEHRAAAPEEPERGDPDTGGAATDRDRCALRQRTAPPYDVIDAALRARLAADDPHNVVHLTLPASPAAAAAAVASWLADGVLQPTRSPVLVGYEADDGTGPVRGVWATVALSDPAEGIVLPHENTMAAPVADRLALTESVAGNLEPIWLLYASEPDAPGRRALDAAFAATPDAEFSTDDGVRHRVWWFDDAALHDLYAADLAPRRAVIADGHHRYATARAWQAAMHAAGQGAGPWDRVLAWLVDARSHGPRAQAIHRVLPGQDLDTLVGAARGGGLQVTEAPDVQAAVAALQPGALRRGAPRGVALAAGGRAVWLGGLDPSTVAAALERSGDGGHSPAWRDLDITVLHRYLLGVLGVPDTDEAVGYAHDVSAALTAAEARHGCALLVAPTPVAGVVAVAEAGERMPRKSTLFTPKPRSGVALYLAASQHGAPRP